MVKEQYILDEENYIITNTETGETWNGNGGSDGVPMLIDLVNQLLDDKEKLEESINDIQLDWTQDYQNYKRDTLYIVDKNIKIKLIDGKLCIKVFIPKVNEYFTFYYFVFERELKEYVLGDE